MKGMQRSALKLSAGLYPRQQDTATTQYGRGLVGEGGQNAEAGDTGVTCSILETEDALGQKQPRPPPRLYAYFVSERICIRLVIL